MKNRIWRLVLTVVSVALFNDPVLALDRVDPDGDFSNVPQRLIITYTDSKARDMETEARHLSARGGRTLRFARSLTITRHHVFNVGAASTTASVKCTQSGSQSSACRCVGGGRHIGAGAFRA